MSGGWTSDLIMHVRAVRDDGGRVTVARNPELARNPNNIGFTLLGPPQAVGDLGLVQMPPPGPRRRAAALSVVMKTRRRGRPKKLGFLRYCQDHNVEVDKLLDDLQLCHQCWQTFYCVGVKKTWRRFRLKYPLLCKRYLTVKGIQQLLTELFWRDFGKNRTLVARPALGSKVGCNVRFRVADVQALSREQQDKLRNNQHILADDLPKYYVPLLIEKHPFTINLDRSRPGGKHWWTNTAAPLSPPPPPHHLLLLDAKSQFWVALVIQKDIPTDTVISTQKYLLPFHTDSLNDLLRAIHVLQHLIQHESGTRCRLILDQSHDLDYNDITTARATLNSFQRPSQMNELVLHPFGIRRQPTQRAVERVIAAVKMYQHKLTSSLCTHSHQRNDTRDIICVRNTLNQQGGIAVAYANSQSQGYSMPYAVYLKLQQMLQR